VITSPPTVQLSNGPFCLKKRNANCSIPTRYAIAARLLPMAQRIFDEVDRVRGTDANVKELSFISMALT